MKKLIVILTAMGLMTAGFAMNASAKAHGGKHGGATTGKHANKGSRSHHGFKAADANGDGAVTLEEFKAFREARKAAHQAKHPGKGKSGKHQKAGKGGKGGKKHSLQAKFDNRDQNHDGSISKAEWQATKHHHKGGTKSADKAGKAGKAGKTGKHRKNK